MGQSCCKVEDDDVSADRNEHYYRQSNRTGIPERHIPAPIQQNARRTQIQNEWVQPSLPVRPRVAPPTWTHHRVEIDKTYPKIISPEEASRRLIENIRKKSISYRKKISLDLPMLRELLRALHISNLNLPINQAYTYEFLDEDSKHYKFAMSQFSNRKFENEYSIKCILHVWNPYLFAQYKLKKLTSKEEPKKRLLFHGTRAEHLVGILTNNFDWRKVKNGKCGWGISFGNNPWYASHYSTKVSDGDNGDYVMFLAKVLVGRTSHGDGTTIVPAIGCDTTTRPQDDQVLVKYDDGSFYPEFLVYFQRKRRFN